MSLLTWTAMDLLFYRKPSAIGAGERMITGLVAITPAAGVVTGWGAICMGLISGSVPFLSMNVMGRGGCFPHKVDDCLGVFHTHAVAGFLVAL